MYGLNFRHAAFEFRHTDDDVWPRPLSTSEFPRLSSFAVVFFFFCHEVCEFNTLEEDHLPPLFILSYFCPTTNFCPAHLLRLSRTPNSPVVLPAQRPNVFPFQKLSKTAPPQSLKQANTHHWAATCRGATYQSGEQEWWGRGEEKQDKLVLKRDEKGAKTLHH